MDDNGLAADSGAFTIDVPSACTLPRTQHPLRTAEWAQVFADAVVPFERMARDRARLQLRPEPEVAARAAELAVRETECCSFFTFSVIATGGQLTLDIAVPATQASTLDLFNSLATIRPTNVGGAG